MAMRTRAFFVLSLMAGASLHAELFPPNEAGVTMGHVHMIVKDVDVATRFWVDMIGGKVVTNGKIREIEFPGVYLLLRQGDATGPAAGSVVEHFGFVVKDLPPLLVKWKANGYTYTQAVRNHNQAIVTGPDGVKLEVFGVPDLPTPVAMNHVHYRLLEKEIPAVKTWYSKNFGWIPSTRESVSRPGAFMDTVELPGMVNLSLAVLAVPNPEAQAPTKGRFIDHIGFEVKNLDAFVKKLEAQGVKFDEPVRRSPNAPHLKTAFLTDPWGARIELTEGLSPAK